MIPPAPPATQFPTFLAAQSPNPVRAYNSNPHKPLKAAVVAVVAVVHVAVSNGRGGGVWRRLVVVRVVVLALVMVMVAVAAAVAVAVVVVVAGRPGWEVLEFREF